MGIQENTLKSKNHPYQEKVKSPSREREQENPTRLTLKSFPIMLNPKAFQALKLNKHVL
jgi:hypothetical protein